MGYIEAAQRLANLFAFSIGGLIVQGLRPMRFLVAIAITACAVALGFVTSLTLRESQHPGYDSARWQGSWKLLASGMGLLRDNRLFRHLVLLSLATIPFRDYLGSLYQPHFVRAGVPSPWFGTSLSLASGLSILGARYAYWFEDRLGSTDSLTIVTALPGALYLLMAAVSSPVFSVLIFCALYGSMSLKGPLFAGRLNAHIDSENRATILSLISMVSGIYVSLMGLLIGHVADLSISAALALMGGIVLVGAIVFRPITQASEVTAE